ncbi:MAG: hypothetical protein WBV82_17140 [Myxococcaceae bacterium]
MTASPERTKQQEWIFDELAELIRRHGPGRFARGVLVQPIPAHFPDPWSPDEDGVANMIHRLLGHAGLTGFDVEVGIFEEETEFAHVDAPLVGNSWRKKGAAAWYAGKNGNTFLFGVEEDQIADPEVLVGTLAHEVAHAFRDHHGLMVEERDDEELLTDLTTFYLGFGVLSVNASYRYRSSGDYAWTQWSHHGVGYLPPPVMSYVLALQAVVRELPVRKVAALLETNQASWFRDEVRKLERDRPRLLERLGLDVSAVDAEAFGKPDVELKPLPPRARPIVALDADSDIDSEEPAEIVFRVRRTGAIQGFLLGLVMSAVAVIVASRLGVTSSPALVFTGLAPTLIGTWTGLRFSRDHCSDIDCQGPIAEGDLTCGTCGGEIKGTIQSARDRLAAEEALSESSESR